jgi:hypothetical protein
MHPDGARRRVPKSKFCKGCHVEKSADEFSVIHRRDGAQWLSYRCRPCTVHYERLRTKTPSYRARHKRYRRNSRQRALTHYSNGGSNCACCGESRYEFLALDHIHGKGQQQRNSTGTKNLDRWARINGWPAIFRVLCHNCNLARGFYGHCPHEIERVAECLLSA